MGEALGQAYVAKTFSPEARDRARAVIDDVRAAFGERLRRLEWMSDSTRVQALAKLGQMGQKVGYPEQWRDYSRLLVAGGPFVLNLQHVNAFDWQRVVNRPGSPVDKTDWEMTVPTVNAYYDTIKNEMVFPAGALAPQTFDPAADDAANYGSLGASWAGHELTYGFDDEGRHFDSRGNLRDWWTPAESVYFWRQAAMVAEQFDAYVQVDTLRVTEGSRWARTSPTSAAFSSPTTRCSLPCGGTAGPGPSTGSRRSSGSFCRTHRPGAAIRAPSRSGTASPWTPAPPRCGGRTGPCPTCLSSRRRSGASRATPWCARPTRSRIAGSRGGRTG